MGLGGDSFISIFQLTAKQISKYLLFEKIFLYVVPWLVELLLAQINCSFHAQESSASICVCFGHQESSSFICYFLYIPI